MVIPAFQAAATIGRVVAAVRAAVADALVIVVDDGSTDGSDRAAAAAGAMVQRHLHNLGKGAALQTGIATALGAAVAAIVTLDADGQHPPREIPRLLEPIQQGSADLVLGARPRGGGMPLSRRASNWLSSVLATHIVGAAIPDAQTGFRAFTRAVGERVRPRERHYDWELSFLLAAANAGFRVTAVPIPTVYGEKSHFGYVRDTLRMMRVFARYGRRKLRGGT